MKSPFEISEKQQQGAVLIVSVFILAAVVILIGFGRLLAYKHQVCCRLDRQREIQQVLASRSAISYLQTTTYYPEEDERFPFYVDKSENGKKLDVIISPAKRVFPQVENTDHFDPMGAKTNAQYIADKKYVHLVNPNGEEVKNIDHLVSGEGNAPYIARWQVGNNKKNWPCGIVMANGNSKTGDVTMCYLELDSENFGDLLWTSDPYGRRYKIEIDSYCEGSETEEGDRIRFGLTPIKKPLPGKQTSPGENLPASIWMDIQQPFLRGATTNDVEDSSNTNKYEFLVYTDMWIADHQMRERLLKDYPMNPAHFKGIQLAGRFASIYEQTRVSSKDDMIRKTQNSDPPVMLPENFISNFVSECSEGIRLTLEVTALRPRTNNISRVYDRFYRLSVTPAYEYGVFLEWPTSQCTRAGERLKARERSTILRVDPMSRSMPGGLRIFSYDTHGTFIDRKDHVY